MKAIYRALCISLAALPLLVVACGDEDGEEEDEGAPLTCAWLVGDNCWKESATAAAEGCAPGGEATGVLSADGKSCAFDDGAVINFAKPIDLEATKDIEWDFTIVRDGKECASFRDSTNDGAGGQVTLTTSLGTFTEEVDGTTLSLTCPDGAAYSANGFSLLQCEDALSILPGTITFGGGSSVSFSLSGGAGGAVPLFTCQSAP